MAKQSKINWQAAREAVALGATLRHVSDTYGMTYDSIKQRVHREKWPRPEQLSLASVQSPLVTAAQSWQQRGEQHRTTIFAMTQRALAAVADCPPELTNWSDIERASRLADKAAGLEQAQPMVSLTFPQVQSTEAPSYIEI